MVIRLDLDYLGRFRTRSNEALKDVIPISKTLCVCVYKTQVIAWDIDDNSIHDMFWGSKVIKVIPYWEVNDNRDVNPYEVIQGQVGYTYIRVGVFYHNPRKGGNNYESCKLPIRIGGRAGGIPYDSILSNFLSFLPKSPGLVTRHNTLYHLVRFIHNEVISIRLFDPLFLSSYSYLLKCSTREGDEWIVPLNTAYFELKDVLVVINKGIENNKVFLLKGFTSGVEVIELECDCSLIEKEQWTKVLNIAVGYINAQVSITSR